ncbi:MAG: LysE family transporter [Candidatus Aureabacteria bacterium]|nr:LysE family transporter [Candidatus Auribacterota bacterium]
MDYFWIFVFSFFVALTGALSPGPLLAACISESTKHGFKSGPLMILGHAIIEMLMICFLLFGFAQFINNPLILKTIGVIGAVILVYFGSSMIFSLPGLVLDFKPRPKTSSSLIMLGITLSLSNPYWTIWWLTFGFGLVLSAQKAGITAVGVFFLGHILADFLWYSIVSLTMSKGKRFLSLGLYKTIIFICGLALIGFGIAFGIASLLKN